MQFIETARKPETHTFFVVTKALKRYGPYSLYKLMALTTTAHDEARAVSNIYPGNQHEAQMRRDRLTRTNIAPQNLSPKLTLLYGAIFQNPEKCPRIDHATQELREYIREEAKLIAEVKKVDSGRHKDLPV